MNRMARGLIVLLLIPMLFIDPAIGRGPPQCIDPPSSNAFTCQALSNRSILPNTKLPGPVGPIRDAALRARRDTSERRLRKRAARDTADRLSGLPITMARQIVRMARDVGTVDHYDLYQLFGQALGIQSGLMVDAGWGGNPTGG